MNNSAKLSPAGDEVAIKTEKSPGVGIEAKLVRLTLVLNPRP